MRIGIDLAVLETGFAERGVATYLRGLLGGLARIGCEEELLLFAARPETAAPFLDAGLRGHHVPADPPGRLALLRAACGRHRPPRHDRLDLLHSPGLGLAPARGRVRTTTVHDVIPLVFAREYLRTLRDRIVYRALLRDSIAADRIAAVSDATRTDLVERLGVPRDRVRVIPEAVEEAFRPLADADRDRAAGALRLPRPYLLFVGGMTVPEPRKNLPRLLEAFVEIARERPDLTLVLAGKTGDYAETVRGLAGDLGFASRLHFTGLVDREALIALYNLAEAFVFPSRYEGFGLPVLEAMACGTPVVCARASSLPEVAGDAALFFEPEDTEGLVDAVGRVLADDGLRRDLIDRGHRRAAGFSWEETARATLALWRGTAAH